MTEYRTRALVLRTFDHGESDRLVHLYTESLGRVSAIAKGARRSRRRFPGTLEIFNVLESHIVDPPRASLMRLEGATLRRGFEGLPRALGRYAIASQLLELLDRFTGEHEANPGLYHFAVGYKDQFIPVFQLVKTRQVRRDLYKGEFSKFFAFLRFFRHHSKRQAHVCK